MLKFHHRWLNSIEEYRRIQSMNMRCYRKILRISYEDHVTNEEVRAKIQLATGPQKDLLTIILSVVSMSTALVLSKAITPVQKTTTACNVWLIGMLVENWCMDKYGRIRREQQLTC